MSATLIVGDVHLGKSVAIGKPGVGSTLNSRIADQFNLLDWVMDQALENNANAIILTGDICEDVKPDYVLMTFFLEWLKKCELNKIDIHIITGNHDIKRTGSHYLSALDIIQSAEISNTFVYKQIETIYNGTVGFTLLPFKDRRSFDFESSSQSLDRIKEMLLYESSEIPYTYSKVLIGHLAIEGSIIVGDEFDDTANELMCPINMFDNYDYIWMGHVHKPQVMKKDNPYIAHIGSMDISNFGETDHKKHIVVFNCIEENGWHIEHLPTRPLQKITIIVPKDTPDTTQFVLDEIKKSGVLEQAIVRVEVSLTAPDLKSINKQTIEKFLTANGAFNVTGISESKKVNLIKKDNSNTIDTKMDVISAIKTYAQAYVEDVSRDAFMELALDIYSAYKVDGKE